MYVVADHRDRGVGRQLLEALVAFADDRGLVRIVLSPSERSVAFYRRAGFDAAGELLVRPRTAHHQPAD
jgi:GNAT superfamily N-acetyltransferase